ncbi:unnamed protein product [Amoebophrya sp. A25]|nr:unnamed protein product [Amoebophrya sp. A25]|eukprot:GSA25T00004245001.1
MQAVAASPMHLHSAPTAGRVPIRGDLPNPQDVQAAHSYGASRVVPPHQPAFSGRTVPPPRISPRGDQGFTGAVRRSRSPPREERPPSAMDVDFEGVEEIRGSRISGQIAVRYVAPLETRSAPTYPHAVPKIAALPGAQGPFSPRTQALKNMEARGRRQQHADERHARSHAHSRHHHALPRGAGDNRNNNVSPPSQPRHQHPQKVDDSKKELSFLERALTIPAEQAPQLLLRTDTLAPSRRVKPVEPAHRPPGSPKPRLDTPYQVKRHTLLGNIPKINIFSPKSALKRINEVPASASEPAEGDEVESYHQNVQHQKKRRMVNAEGEAAFESSQSGLFDSPTETAHVDNARGDESCFSFEPEYPSASSGNALLTEGDEDSIVEQTGKEGRSCRNVKEPISAAPQPHISQHLAQGRETPEDYFNHVTQSELRSKDTAAPESSCGTQAAKEQEAVRESWPVFAFNGNEEQIESCSQDDEGAGSLSTPDQVLETDSVPAGRAFPQSVVEAALPDLVHQTSNLDVAELVAEEGGSHQFMTNPSAHGVLRSNSCSSAPRTSNYNMGVDHLQGYGMDVAALLRDSLDEMSENDQEHDATFTTQATVTLAEARSGASPIAGFLVVQDSDVDAEAVMYNNKSTSVFANSAFPSHREMHSLDLGSLLETDNSERAGTTCSSQDGGAPRLKLSPRNLDMLPRVQTATQANAAAAWTSAGGPPQLRNDSSSASLNTEVEVITYLPSTVANMVSPPPSVVGGAIETQSTALGSASQGGGSSSERDHQMIPESRTEHPTASEDVSTDMSRREVSTGPTNVKNRIKMFENLSHGDSPRTGTSPRAAACPKKLNIPTAFNSPHHDHIDSTPPGHHARASSSAKPVEVSEKKRDHVEESVSISNTKNSGSTGKVLDDGQSSQEDVVPTRAFDTAAFIVPAPKAFPDAGFVDMDGGGFYQDGPFHLSDALPRVPRQTQAKQDEERFHKSFAERALARLQDGLDMHAEHEEELQELAEMMGLDVDELRRSHQFRNSTNFALNAAALGTADTLGETPRSASSSGKGVIAGEMDVDQSVFHVGDDLSHLARNRLLLEQVQKHAEVLGMSPAEVLREQLEHDQVEHQQALNHARRASATGETTIGMGAGVFNSATRPETTEATPEHQVMMQLALLQILVASEGAFRKSSISEGKYNYIAIPASMGEEAVRAASDKYSTKHPHENHEQQHQQHRQSHHNQLQQHHKNKKRQHQQQHHRQRRHSSYHRHNSVIAQGAAQDAYALDVDELTAKMAQLRLDSVSEEAHHGVSSSAGHSESVEEMQAAMGLNGRQDAALQHEQRREREAQAEKLESLRAGVAELAEDAAHAAAELAEHQADESHDHAEHDQVENRAPQGHETRAQMSHMKNANHDDEEAHLEHLEDMHKLMDSSKRLSGSILHATVGELSEDSGDEDRAAFHALARRSQNLLEQVDRILRLRPMQRAYNRLRMIRALRGGHLEATASSYSGGAEKSAAEKKIIYNNSSDLGGGYELLAGGANRFSPSWNADLRQPLVKGAEGEAAAPQEEGGEDGEQSQEQFLYYDSPSGTSGGVPSEELSPALHERTLEVGTLLLSPPDEDAPPENMSVNVNLRIQAPEGEGPPHQIQQQQQQDVPTSNVEYFQRDSSRLFSSVAAAGQDFEEVPSPVPAVPAPKRILRPVSPAMNATTSTGSDNRSFSEPRPFVIGVCGASCSGKTTVCDILRAEFMTTDSRVAFLPSDSYYKSLTDAQKALAHEGKYDFDVPEALDWQDLLRDLRTLKQGKEPVQLPMYSFKTHSRIQLPEDGSPFPDDVDLTGVSGGDVLQPSDVIIVEGILVFAAGQALLDEIDMKIFIDCDSDVRLARRLQRDIVERGREFDGILKQYLRFVRPSYTNYVEPSRRYADVIIPNNNQEHTEGVASLRRNCVISMILDHIKLHLAQRRRIRRLEQKQQEQPQQGNISEKRTATSKDSSTSSNNPGTLTPNHQHLNNLLTLSNPFSRPVSSPTSHDVPASSVTARWESSSAAGTPVIGPRKLKQKQN